MTFPDFLRVFAINLLANTLPLCICLFATAYLIIKLYDKRLDKIMDKKISKMFENYNTNINLSAKRQRVINED